MSNVWKFLHNTHIVYFSMEIALRDEMHTSASARVSSSSLCSPLMENGVAMRAAWLPTGGEAAQQHRRGKKWEGQLKLHGSVILKPIASRAQHVRSS